MTSEVNGDEGNLATIILDDADLEMVSGGDLPHMDHAHVWLTLRLY